MNLLNMSISALRCPSSPLDQFGGGGNAVCMASYAGIMGAVDNQGAFIETQTRPCCTCCGGQGANGMNSGGGMLRINQMTKFADCLDGTSNTMIVGETSDWAIDSASNNAPRRIDPSWPHGFAMGQNGASLVTGQTGNSDYRPFNLTAIRYPIGTREYNLPGVHENHGSNNPLLSAHPGGTQMLLTDGSARFGSASTDLLTLKFLATRADGQPLANF